MSPIVECQDSVVIIGIDSGEGGVADGPGIEELHVYATEAAAA
jgi:hypothetical protein